MLMIYTVAFTVYYRTGTLIMHCCERELNYLDMNINFNKSSCLRIGPRHDVTCANVVSLNGSVIAWTAD